MKAHSMILNAASLAFASFIALLAIGFVSLPVFFAAAMTWFLLLTVNAYTPRERANWMPRRIALKAARKAEFPLAA